MYIKHKLASAFYKLSLGLISLYGFWATISSFGANAWRFFSTWALIVGAIYYCLTALILTLSNKRKAGDSPSAMFEGMIIVACVIQGAATISCNISDEYLPGLSGFPAVVAYYVLPILALLDWCLFNKKGQWRAIDPFYWIALPLSYSAMIILTANMLPSSAPLRYPIPFLDYNSYGLWEMLGWLAFIGLLILIFGYILVLLDAFMGGVIAKHIVLPHIRTVSIADEETSEAVESDKEDSELLSEESLVEEPSIKTDAQETAEPAELENTEAGEIITDEPKNKPKTSLPKTNPNNKTQSSRTRSAKTQPSKTAKSQTSNKTSSQKSSNKRKINDVTKPKNNSQSGKPASSVHKKTTK